MCLKGEKVGKIYNTQSPQDRISSPEILSYFMPIFLQKTCLGIS